MTIITQNNPDRKSKNKFQIRKSKVKDIPCLFSLWEKFTIFHQTNTKGKFGRLKENAPQIWKKLLKKHMYSKNSLVLIAEKNQKLIAYAIFKVSYFPEFFKINKEVFLDELFVEKKFRKKGIGENLIKEGLKWGKKKGLIYANLHVCDWNKSAQKFYKETGFRIRSYNMKNY